MNKPDTIAFAGAHPDDLETLFGKKMQRTARAVAIVATNGEASTIDRIGGGFVAEGNRLYESADGLKRSGVAEADQHHLYLPDGGLFLRVGRLVDDMVEIVRASGARALVSFGHQGYDGHIDHVTMHHASRITARETGIEFITRRDLLDRRLGFVSLTGDDEAKHYAMAAHISQGLDDEVKRARQLAAYQGDYLDEAYFHNAPVDERLPAMA